MCSSFASAVFEVSFSFIYKCFVYPTVQREILFSFLQ